MESQTAPCEKCRVEISTDAEKCPHCGYDPQRDGRTMRKVFTVAGALLTASVVGAPIGIPMLVFAAYANRKVGEKRPAAA